MLSPAANYDILCLQMWNSTSQLDDPMRARTEAMMATIKEAVLVGGDTRASLQAIFPQLFEFRIQAHRWLTADGAFDLEAAMKAEVWPQIEAIKQQPRLAILADNILFAFRCNLRVVRSILKGATITKEGLSEATGAIEQISYNQLMAAMAYGIPGEEQAQLVMDWVGCGLFIEAITAAAVLIHEQQLNVDEETIASLAALIADAAQTNIAAATMLGALPQREPSYTVMIGGQDDDASLREEHKIADAGLYDLEQLF